MRIRMKATIGERSPLAPFLPSELRAIGRDVAKQIRQRTRSGRDVNGQPFERLASGEPSRLRQSGKMLRSLRARKFWRRGFQISPSQPVRNLARRHQLGKGNMPKRTWIGFSERQIQEMADRATAAYLRKADGQ